MKFTLNAAPRTGPDTGYMWYYGGLNADSVYIGSGGVQPSGDKPITITLDKPIRNVQIVWQFSPAPGGKITLYNSQDSVLDMHDVGSSPEPSPYEAGGSPSGFHTQETHVFANSGVRKIRLEGGGRLPWTSQSWILAQLFFDPDTICPPTNDSILDRSRVRDTLIAALERSNPDSAPGSGYVKELGGLIWRLPDGTFLATEETDPLIVTSTECSLNMNAALVVPPVPGAVAVAFWHSHPHGHNADVYECEAPPGQPALAKTPGDGKPVPKARPDANGGGSTGDWDAAKNSGIDGYVINKDGRIYRLGSATLEKDRGKNPNKWEWKNPAQPGCLTKVT